MCAQFLLKAQAHDLERTFGITLRDPETFFSEPDAQRVLPHQNALVVTAQGFRVMVFSLTPSWSKERRTKYATYNARLETLTTKPTWKTPFETRRCVVPMTTFIEPAYENELAGNMVSFHTPENKILCAAGIYDQWVDKESGEVFESFAVITTEPYALVTEKTGHDRSPLFLKENSLKDWLDPAPKKSAVLLNLLKEAKQIPTLSADKDRAMKPGWEKRKKH